MVELVEKHSVDVEISCPLVAKKRKIKWWVRVP